MEALDLSFMRRILAINRQISLLQDVDPILGIIIDSMIEFTRAERGYLILREGGVDLVKVTRNMDPLKNLKSDGEFSTSVVGKVLKTGRPIITVNAMEDERFSASNSIQDLKLRSIVCLPFRVREAVIGAVYLENRKEAGVFSESMIELLQAFADQAAIAITNAWVFEELKKGAAEIQSSQPPRRRPHASSRSY